MPEFEIIDHTADIGIIAYGNSPAELFSRAAAGMFEIITDTDTIRETVRKEISAKAPNQAELLVSWLNELLFLLDTEGLIFRRFEIKNITGTTLAATGFGEKYDPQRHEIKTPIKAATYHQLRLENENGFRAQVILDV